MEPTHEIQTSAFGFERALSSLARMLLRRGVTAHEFSRWTNAAFVGAALDLLREHGKEISYSRISALTGIHRHAVSNILAARQQAGSVTDATKSYQKNRLARVLTGWHEDPKFTTADGRPRTLRLEGEDGSFADLVRTYSGDIYAGIILDELERVGAVRRTADDRIQVISRRYTVGGPDSESLSHAALVASDLLRTIEHNTLADPGDRLYEDSAIAVNLPPQIVPMLSRLLDRRASTFLDDMEGWLNSLERNELGDLEANSTVRAGVRVVMVVEPESDAPAADDKK